MARAPRSKAAKAKAASRARLRLDDAFFPTKAYTYQDPKKKRAKPQVEERPVPNFAVQETATTFFGRSPDWLRWRYRPDTPAEGEPRFPHGYFVLDDEVLEPRKTLGGARYYTLPDIEKMAFALADADVVDPWQLACILNIVYANAYLHGVLRQPIVVQPPEPEESVDAAS